MAGGAACPKSRNGAIGSVRPPSLGARSGKLATGSVVTIGAARIASGATVMMFAVPCELLKRKRSAAT